MVEGYVPCAGTVDKLVVPADPNVEVEVGVPRWLFVRACALDSDVCILCHGYERVKSQNRRLSHKLMDACEIPILHHVPDFVLSRQS